MKTENRKFGLLNKIIDNPAIYIMSKNHEYDFILTDLEHGYISRRKLHDLILFGNNIGLPTIIRVAEISKKEISGALDLGAQGIIIPMVETQEEVNKIISYSYYPPIGKRSYSGGANTNYAGSGNHAKNIEEAHNKIMVAVQIESQLGYENAESIISTPGINTIIIGPADLSIAMGNVDKMVSPQQIKALNTIVSLCKKHNKKIGIIGSLSLLAKFKFDLDYFISAIDVNLLNHSIKEEKDKYIKMFK